MHPGKQGAVVLLEHAVDGKIKRVDLCSVLAPEDTRPLADQLGKAGYRVRGFATARSDG